MTFSQLLMGLIHFSLIHFAFLQVCRAVGDLFHLFNSQSLRTHGTHLLRFQQPGHTNRTDYHTTMQLTYIFLLIIDKKIEKKLQLVINHQTSLELAWIQYPLIVWTQSSWTMLMHLWLTERIVSGEQEIHNEDTHTSLLSAYGDPEQPNKVPDEQESEEKWFCCRQSVCRLYRGNAVG